LERRPPPSHIFGDLGVPRLFADQKIVFIETRGVPFSTA
jgi:hypothetical protein